jgi:HK97 family phage major capsid protein
MRWIVATEETGMMEVKADGLEASFDGVAGEALAAEVGVLRGEVAGLKGRIDAALVARGRPALSGVKGEDGGEAKAFVERYLRKGLESGVELKSLSAASDGAGGYAVPREIDAVIDATLKTISPIRAIANVVKVGSAGYRKLVTQGGVASGWAAETAARPETGTPSFAEIAPPMGDLYANPAASQAMLDDAAFDLETWLAGEIATEFARAEGSAFVSGNGTNRPRGFLSAPTATTADGVRPFGTLQYLATGTAGAFAASNPQDRLVDLVHALRPGYRQGASFVMNSSTLARIRKMKTTDGAFIWQPSMAEGQPATLLGYPVIEAEDMPDVAADSVSVAFGNFKAGYLIAERSETQILRDPFTNKPFVHFYAVKRVGGTVSNSEAIKLLKFSAS